MNVVLVRAAAAAAETAEMPDWLVCVIGVGIVFVGLISLIVICSVMGLFFRSRNSAEAKSAAPAVTPTPAVTEPIPHRQELIAAVSAAIAEELGTDVAGLKILSIRRL